MNKKKIKKRGTTPSEKVSRVLVIETAIFMSLMSIVALGLVYALTKLLLFFLDGIKVGGPAF